MPPRVGARSSANLGIAWETASVWRDSDAGARRAADHIRDELRRRYAIDVESLDAEPGAVQDALERRERALRLAQEAREQARVDEVVGAPLLVSAAHADRDQAVVAAASADTDRQPRAEVLYDSAERRRQLAAELEGVADDEAIEARVVADTNQAQPPEDAVASAPRRAPTGRRARGRAGRRGARRSRDRRR
jgi:colicin import membrane protein